MKLKPDTSVFFKPSVVFIIFTFCFCTLTMDMWRAWHPPQSNFVWDVMNYYSYLPAEFCNDGSFDYHNSREMYLPRDGKGNYFPKVTYGVALMYAPWFALGYKIAYNEKAALDGFSEPFSTCIHWGSILYALLGLVFLRQFLRRFFSEWVTTITLAVVFYGTALFHYTLTQSEMSHAHLFFLISAFLLSACKWNERTSWPLSTVIGFLLGLISLIRPTEILIGSVFVFWGVNSLAAFKMQARKLWESKWHLCMIAFTAFLVWLPQLIFWKARTGQYFFFSYGDEKFFWTDPQIVNILFSYRKGWLTYSPLVWLVLTGFFFMRGEERKFRPLILILLLLNIYMLSCWWDWFFGGGFGARAFTQHIAYLSLPLASLTKFFLESDFFSGVRRYAREAFLAVVFFGISLSVGQSLQYVKLFIHFNAMTEETYWLIWRKYYLTPDEQGKWWGTLKEPDYPKLKNGEKRDQ